MKKTKGLIFAITSIMLFSSCSHKIDNNRYINRVSLYEIKEPSFETRKIKSIEEVTYMDLFNLGNIVTIKIDISDEELSKLQEDYKKTYKSAIYRHCDVKITLKNYDKEFEWYFNDVGIRQKGNTSRFPMFEDNEIKYQNHYKLSFDETFDDEKAYKEEAYVWDSIDEREQRENRHFLSLKGLDLRWNKNFDSSHIREVYASKLYQSCGLLAQQMGLSNVEIVRTSKNKKYDMGVYTISEPLSSSFIKRHLQNDSILNFGTWEEESKGKFGVKDSKYGDLYRSNWGDLSLESLTGGVGVGTSTGANDPQYERKTNVDIEYSNDLIWKFGTAITKGNYSDISSCFDMEYFASYEAVSYLLGNPDDFRNDLCNYCIYFRRSDGKGVIIPYDYDRCFGITKDWNPGGKASTNLSLFHEESPCEGVNVSPLFKKTILASKDYKVKLMYQNYVKKLLDSEWFDPSTYERYYEIARLNYQDSVDSCILYVGFNNDKDVDNGYTFASYLEEKKKNIGYDESIKGEAQEEELSNDLFFDDYKGYYGELYLACDKNSWKGKEYPFKYEGEGNYTITFTLGVTGDQYFKIFDGNYWRINWTITNGKLNKYNGDGFLIKNLKKDSEITISFNTITSTTSIEVK